MKDHVPLIRIKRYRNIYKEFVPAQETWYRKDGVLTTMQGLRMKNKKVRDVYCGLTATKCSSLITEIRKTDDRWPRFRITSVSNLNKSGLNVKALTPWYLNFICIWESLSPLWNSESMGGFCLLDKDGDPNDSLSIEKL